TPCKKTQSSLNAGFVRPAGSEQLRAKGEPTARTRSGAERCPRAEGVGELRLRTTFAPAGHGGDDREETEGFWVRLVTGHLSIATRKITPMITTGAKLMPAAQAGWPARSRKIPLLIPVMPSRVRPSIQSLSARISGGFAFAPMPRQNTTAMAVARAA